MNKIKVIDLLNMISKGEEVPKKIKFDNKEYENEPCYMLYEATGDRNELQFKKFLNDEVEILEEEKKIPEKLDTLTYTNRNTISIWNEYRDKINEIIDYLKSKGE